MTKEDFCFFASLSFLGGFTLCFVIACYVGDRRNEHWRADAIEHGAAEYVITDPASGAVEFRWRPVIKENLTSEEQTK